MPPEKDILKTLTSILCANLNNSSLLITRESNLSALPSMDSIKMVNIILDVEDAFGLRFTAVAIDSLFCVNDLISSIQAGVAAAHTE